MKKKILLSIICVAVFLSGCGTASKPDFEKENDVQNIYYQLTGEHRDERVYTVEDGKMKFPLGKIIQVRGATTGTEEKDLIISKSEIGEIVDILERDAIAWDSSEILEPVGTIDWTEGYGIVYLTIETANSKEKTIYLQLSSGDVITGGTLERLEISFEIESRELAEKLKNIIGFKRVDLSVLDRAVSVTYKSLVNGNTVTVTDEKLEQLVYAAQTAKKELATNVPKAISIEILLDDGEVVQAAFTGTGYNKIGVEAELYEMSEESVKPLLELFEEQNMPLFFNEDWNKDEVKETSPDSSHQNQFLNEDEAILTAQKSLSQEEKKVITNFENPEIETIVFSQEPTIFLYEPEEKLAGKSLYKISFYTTEDNILGPIILYLDAIDGKIYGLDYRE